MTEIKISDLSVGDWIATESAQLAIEGNDIATAFVEKVKKPIQIVSVLGTEQLVFGRIEELDGFTTIYLKSEHIEPIPLTPEILEKNGLVRGEYSEIRVYNEWEMGEWSDPPYVSVRLDIDRQVIRVTNRGRDMFIAEEEVYVHQLQHALRLANVEKEIEL